MRYWMLAVLLCLLIAGCSTARPRSGGSGVDVQIINRAELSDIYFSYYADRRTPTPADLPSPSTVSGTDLVELVRLSALVHNKGYADTLVALYITGYDPNLFYVQPLGPYILSDDPRRCYKDIIVQVDQNYEGYVLCQTGDAFLGGGIGVDDDGNFDRARLDAYNVNAAAFLDSVIPRMRGEGENVGFFEGSGLLTNLNINCDWDREGSGYEDSSISIGGGDTACRLSFGMPGVYFERASRGSLLISVFGGDVRNCGNGCTLVPSQNTPKQYLSGDNENTPGGEALYVDYGVWLDRARWPANLNDHEQLFQVTACYLYTTYATPTVCLDPTPALADGEVCRPGVIDMGRGQPAPLSITRIEQHNQGSRAIFTIHVEDTRGGRPFHPGAIDFCSPSAPETYARELRDVAKVVDARVLGSLESLDCGSGTIYLRDGVGQISCSYNMPPEVLVRGQAYQTTLNIEIGYLYRDIQTIRTQIHRI